MLKTLIAGAILLIISFGLVWLTYDFKTKPLAVKLLMVLLVFSGTIAGNFILGFIDHFAVKYLYFTVLGGIIGGWLFLQIFKKTL